MTLHVDADFFGDRFLVRVPLPDATVLRVLADTAGGYAVDPAMVASLPRVPLPGGDGEGVRLPLDPPMPSPYDVARLERPRSGSAGVASAWWFPGRIWALDYRIGRLEILDEGPGGGVALGLSEHEGRLMSPFPRIQADIDGAAIDFVLDTGATVSLTDHAMRTLDEPRVRASSFIVWSVFQRWREQHPDWQVIEHTSTVRDSAMIKVPRVRVGEVELDDVWFEHRPDANFHQHMSQWMDRRIDGALGASAYRGHRLIIDYPARQAALS